MSERHDGRSADQLRPLEIDTSVRSWAEGAALIQMGATTVLCSATVEERVPWHRKGTRAGWVTAEYAMRPRATHERSPRERGGRVEGRSQEIQRLVARSLRAAVDLQRLGERTVIVDCDVIHADGGTRTAAINGGWVALALACRRLEQAAMVKGQPLVRGLAAVSVGLVDGELLLDVDYQEDSQAQADINLVISPGAGLVEIQGTAERQPFSPEELLSALALAEVGVSRIAECQQAALEQVG